MERAAIYARFSTDEQREASIDDQYRACKRVADSLGFDIAAYFKDEALSAGTSQRPGYQALLFACMFGQIDIIVTEDISRLWRNRADYGPRSAELEDKGIHLVTCVGDDTRRDGWGLVLGIKLAIAEAYRREVSYRTKRGMEGKALAGESTGGKVYGYKSTEGVIEVHPEQADTVRGIFECAARGLPLSAIATALNQAGALSPRGGQWGRSSVAAILANPRYTGWVRWGATEGKGGARDSQLKTRVMRSEPLVHLHNEALRIVPDELWNTAEREVTKRACKAACGVQK